MDKMDWIALGVAVVLWLIGGAMIVYHVGWWILWGVVLLAWSNDIAGRIARKNEERERRQ